MKLDRDAIKRGVIDEMVRESREAGFATLLSEEERQESLQAARAAQEPGAPFWVFGYGSLMWNPAFHYAEKRCGLVCGYHRSYCMWTDGGRGTPDLPGLMLALDHGGSCRGMAFRIAEDQVEEELDIIWSREMIGGAYQARWVSIKTEEGTVRALTFVINRDFVRYAGKVPHNVLIAHLATAEGRLGSCIEYLQNTVAYLDALGINDGPMHHILEDARGYRGGSPTGQWENGRWQTTLRKS